MACWLIRICPASAFAILLLASPARAGAFLEPAGQGQIISTVRFTQARASFDASGRAKSGKFYSKAEIQAYAEYGMADWITLVFSPSVQHFRVFDAKPPAYTGLADSELAARVKLLAFGPAIVSVQIGGVSTGDVAGFGHRRLTGRATLQGEARLLTGVGFECGEWSCFAEAQLATRTPTPEKGWEWRTDVTLGVRPLPSVLVLAQSFTRISTDKSRLPAQAHSTKFQLSLVFALSRQISVQLGGFATILGQNTPLERGVLTALWYKF